MNEAILTRVSSVSQFDTQTASPKISFSTLSQFDTHTASSKMSNATSDDDDSGSRQDSRPGSRRGSMRSSRRGSRKDLRREIDSFTSSRMSDNEPLTPGRMSHPSRSRSMHTRRLSEHSTAPSRSNSVNRRSIDDVRKAALRASSLMKPRRDKWIQSVSNTKIAVDKDKSTPQLKRAGSLRSVHTAKPGLNSIVESRSDALSRLRKKSRSKSMSQRGDVKRPAVLSQR